MINVMIVDDEYLVRERIKKCIPWGELGYRIVGEASNGEDALSLIKELLPQIAIVDINMPFLDGLDFSRIVRERYPGTKVIILTGYSSFDYAKSAIQAGVANYLLKPINKDELVDTLNKLKIEIERDTQARIQFDKLRMDSKKSDIILKERYISTLLEGNIAASSGEDSGEINMYCPALKEADSFVAVVDIDRIDQICSNENDKQLWRFAVLNIFDEIISEYCSYVISYDSGGKVVMIIAPDSKEQYEAYFRRLFEKAKKAIKDHLHFTVTVGVGNMYFGIGEISLSYREAVTALKNRVILGGNNIIKYSRLEKKLNVTKDLATVRQDMLINMRLGNTSSVKEKLHMTIFNIYENKHTIESLTLLLSELLVTATSFANDNGIDITDFIGKNLNAEAIITEKEDISEIEKWAEELFVRLVERVNGSRQTNTARVVDKAKSYIDSNFSKENLDLEGIASNIFINVCYLSNIFKKETGKTVIEYLRECRMEKAKKLMDEGVKNLYNIAERVGYSDPHYFSKCFKKYFGISPSKYMEMKVRNN